MESAFALKESYKDREVTDPDSGEVVEVIHGFSGGTISSGADGGTIDVWQRLGYSQDGVIVAESPEEAAAFAAYDALKSVSAAAADEQQASPEATGDASGESEAEPQAPAAPAAKATRTSKGGGN